MRSGKKIIMKLWERGISYYVNHVIGVLRYGEQTNGQLNVRHATTVDELNQL
jgi:hypothetical protein